MTGNRLVLGAQPRDADAPGRVDAIDDTGALLQPDGAEQLLHRQLNLTEPGINE